MQLPSLDTAPYQAPSPSAYPVFPVDDDAAVDVAHDAPAPLALAVWSLALLLAIPVSCLPATWRARIDPDARLPLVAGTLLSALFLYVEAISFFGRALFTGEGWLIQTLSPGVFLLIGMTALFEAAARMLHVLTVRAPIGTLLLWSIERALHLVHLADRRFRGHPDDSTLPRARLLR